MGFVIPIINMDVNEFRARMQNKFKEEKTQKRIVLVIVCIVLLLDNMLYMVIVPIIPDYLRRIGAYKTHFTGSNKTLANGTVMIFKRGGIPIYEGEDTSLGWLFAIKAIVQLVANPFSGTVIDRIGYEIPMTIGLIVMFLSTSVFALGQSYTILFLARSLQGVGSAFADTSGLAMIADRFTEGHERSKAMGIALAFISFGCLVAPPFGGALYEFAGKPVPFMLLALVCLIDGILVFMVINPSTKRTDSGGERVKGTPIHHLFLDPFIAICSGALVMANVSLAFIEPTIAKHMEDTMTGITEWKIGFVWLPSFIPHVIGVYTTIVLLKKHPQWSWILASIGLGMEGISCFFIPFITNYWLMIVPLSVVCFGIALIDTALLPLLGYLVDTRHVSVYGSVYAIADISYSMAYAFGPVVAGGIMSSMGFLGLNIIICLSNVLYVPMLRVLRRIYQYQQVEGTANNQSTKGYSQLESTNGGCGGGGGGGVGGGGYGGVNKYGAVEEDPWGDDATPALQQADGKQALHDYGYDYPQQRQTDKITYPPLPSHIGSKYQQQ